MTRQRKRRCEYTDEIFQQLVESTTRRRKSKESKPTGPTTDSIPEVRRRVLPVETSEPTTGARRTTERTQHGVGIKRTRNSRRVTAGKEEPENNHLVSAGRKQNSKESKPMKSVRKSIDETGQVTTEAKSGIKRIIGPRNNSASSTDEGKGETRVTSEQADEQLEARTTKRKATKAKQTGSGDSNITETQDDVSGSKDTEKERSDVTAGVQGEKKSTRASSVTKDDDCAPTVTERTSSCGKPTQTKRDLDQNGSEKCHTSYYSSHDTSVNNDGPTTTNTVKQIGRARKFISSANSESEPRRPEACASPADTTDHVISTVSQQASCTHTYIHANIHKFI